MMERLKRAAVLARLLERLRERGSWCGETHVQKAAFFLQEMMQVPLGFTFIMYRYGPYSFELRDDLTGLRADELVRLEPQFPYGPRIGLTERSSYIQEIYPRTLATYDREINVVTKWLGPKGVAGLEQCGTAFYVIQRIGRDASLEQKVKETVRLKPHVSREEATAAVEEVGHQIGEVAMR